MIVLQLGGFEEAATLLADWERLLQSPDLWDDTTGVAAEEFRRYAMNISPVITGAYRGSHVIIQDRMAAAVAIDEGAINPVSGEGVTRYAGAVEDRHHVYQRTFDQMARLAGVAGIEVILERLG